MLRLYVIVMLVTHNTTLGNNNIVNAEQFRCGLRSAGMTFSHFVIGSRLFETNIVVSYWRVEMSTESVRQLDASVSSDGVTHYWFFLCSVDRASRFSSCKEPTWRTVLFSYIFIPILYMFQAPLCPSSGESVY